MNKEEFSEKIKKYEIDEDMKLSLESILNYIPNGTYRDARIYDRMDTIIDRYEHQHELGTKYSDLIYNFYEKRGLSDKIKSIFGVDNIRDVDSKNLIKFNDYNINNIREENDKYIIYFEEGQPLASTTYQFNYSNDGNYKFLGRQFSGMS